MKKEDMEKQAAQFVAESRRNVVSLEEAIAPELAGARIFDPPVWGYGDAKDPMFQELKEGSGWTAVFIAGRMASKSEQCDELFSSFYRRSQEQ